jgi:predicted protein tyrosine phosphatase
MKTYTQQMFEPGHNYGNIYQGPAKRALFVCSAGLLRSPTAARVGAIEFGWNTRSCGSHEEYALILLTAQLIHWADAIYFVNPDNYDRALNTFSSVQASPHTETELRKKAVVWAIEDDYSYNDPQLYQMIKELLS